ncbi:MAG TPA: hypothetical protein VGM53_34200 [Streptosporangiaceae bacterium]|jgi:hypothetical protein
MTERAAVVAHCIAMIARGAELSAAGNNATARASMLAMTTRCRTARRPAATVAVLPATNSIPAAAKTRPIRVGDAPAACNSSGTSRADTPVVRPAVRIAAAAVRVPRSPAAARKPAAARAVGRDGRAGARNRLRAAVTSAKTPAAARKGTVSPR